MLKIPKKMPNHLLKKLQGDETVEKSLAKNQIKEETEKEEKNLPIKSHQKERKMAKKIKKLKKLKNSIKKTQKINLFSEFFISCYF